MQQPQQSKSFSKIKTAQQIKEEMIQQREQKLLKQKQRELPDYLLSYFSKTESYDPAPDLSLLKPEPRIVSKDDDFFYEQQYKKMEKMYEKQQKIDDNLFQRQENEKFKQLIKQEIYEDRLQAAKQLQQEKQMQRQILALELEMKRKKQEMQLQLVQQLKQAKLAENAILTTQKIEAAQLRSERDKQYKEAQIRARSQILGMKQANQTQVLDAKREYHVERNQRKRQLQEQLFTEQKELIDQLKTEMNQGFEREGTDGKEVLLQSKIDAARREDERVRTVKERKMELDSTKTQLDEKVIERQEKARQMVEDKRLKGVLMQQQHGKEEAVRNLLGW